MRARPASSAGSQDRTVAEPRAMRTGGNQERDGSGRRQFVHLLCDSADAGYMDHLANAPPAARTEYHAADVPISRR